MTQSLGERKTRGRQQKIVFQIPRSMGVRPYIFCIQFSGVVELNFDSVEW